MSGLDVLPDTLRMMAVLALIGAAVWAPAYLAADWIHRGDRKPRTGGKR